MLDQQKRGRLLSRYRTWGAIGIFLAALGASPSLFAGVYLTVRNSPSLALTVTNLASGAGSDLTTTQTVTMQHLIDVNVYGFNAYLWEVDVALTSGNLNWPAGTTVTVKRTGNGGNSNISGGTGGIQVTNSPQTLFTGRGSVTGVSVQYTVSGFNLANCPPGTNYTYPLTFTFGT